MILLKNILVATDFGEASDAALTYGRDLARTFGLGCMCCTSPTTSWSGLPTKCRWLFSPSCRTEIEEGARGSGSNGARH